jgi:hypothetical protein
MDGSKIKLTTKRLTQASGVGVGILTGVVYAVLAAQATFVFNGRDAPLFVVTMLVFLCPIPLGLLGIRRPALAGRGMIGAGLIFLLLLLCFWALKGSPQGIGPVVRGIVLSVAPFLISGALLLIAGRSHV